MRRVPNLNLTHCEEISDMSSEGEFVPNPEYDDCCLKLPISEEDETRSLLFRRTPNGIIVYDSKARYSDDDRPNIQMRLSPKDITEEIQRDAEKCPEFGNIHPDRVKFLTSPVYPPQKYVNEEYTLVVPSAALRFDSKFESGNLARAVMIDEDDYELMLDYDTETKGYTQWYYFSVVSRKPRQRVRFSIVNLMKYESLYNNGLQPLIRVGQGEWGRGGSSIAYYQNSIPRPNPINDPKIPPFHYTLTFTYELVSPGEPVYFAHCYPYTYTDLLTYVQSLQQIPTLSTRLRVDTLCKSLGGNDCLLLTITDHVDSFIPWLDEETIMLKSAAGRKFLRQRAYRLDKSVGKEYRQVENEHRQKKGIVLTARVHPGETNSSYMMKGAIDFLLSEAKEAVLLRRRFVFRLVPMLNPDGVIYGNYRCGLLGVDLNRRWQSPSKYLHPTVYYTKRFMQYFAEEYEIALYCDMHGHSMKKNMFVYANSLKSIQEHGRNTNVLIKLVPKLLAKANKLFSFKDSHFRIEHCKLSTARVVVFKELGVINSYTLEASFYGPKTQAQLANQEPMREGEDQDAQMHTTHMESLGRDLCRVMVAFTSQRAFRMKLNEVANAIREEMLQPVPPSVALKRSQTNKASSRTEQASYSPDGGAISYRSQAPPTSRTPTTPSLSQLPRPEEEEDVLLDVQTAIQTISEVKELPEEMGLEDLCSDSGGSDSLGSDNDDSKQTYFYRKKLQLNKTKKRNKKDTLPKRDPKPHSCLRHHADTSHAFCRPKTPFVFGNYPARKSASRISKLLKSLQTQSPRGEVQSRVPIVPSQVLLAGLQGVEEIPKVKVVTGAGGLKNSALPVRVSFCPSTSILHSSKEPDMGLRIRTSRIIEAVCKDPRLKISSKLALRKLPATPVLTTNPD